MQGAHSAETESQTNTGGGDVAAVDQPGEVGEAAPGGESTAGEAVKDSHQADASPESIVVNAVGENADAVQAALAKPAKPAKTTKAAKK